MSATEAPDIQSSAGQDVSVIALIASLGVIVLLLLAIAQQRATIEKLMPSASPMISIGSGHKFAVGFLDACGNPCVITANYGGVIGDFKSLADEVNTRKQAILIDGDCVSACALFADLARKNVRITRRARFWFHQSSIDEPPPQSADITAWVTSHGGFPTFESGRLTMMDFNTARRFWKPVFEWQHIPVDIDAPYRWPTFMPGIDEPIQMRGTVQ